MEDEGMISYKKWDILRNISLLNLKGDITISELKVKLEVIDTDRYFYEILKELMDLEIIVNTKRIGITNFVKVDNKKLNKYFRETIIFKKCGEWIENKVLGHIY